MDADPELSPVELQILWLHVIQRTSFAEIAVAVNLPKSTTYDLWVGVRTRLAEHPEWIESLARGEGTQW